MLHQFAEKLNQSSTLIIVVVLAFLASILRTEQQSLRSVLTGAVFAGFVAYASNLGLMGIPTIDENQRVFIVGCLTYLNNYVLTALTKFGENVVNNPKEVIASIKEIWKR
ncbi:hypothetical protein C1S86_24335 [Vibrio parahaemolyticus]|uniref:hypothetical protein n=1 Tax=Vibrio parahaemolyticus TaxID=670 RepID=UPI000C87A3F3|nr:hypothetical protein [Vibrio parahaemolyticus]EJB8454807.1 hypothetical protein [Vibrio parahaemolyticus]PMT73885.1 hypothetical protein C1S97_25255 [Vibrio parahaemolyticus]PMT79085.1 hypothetical protein C1S86_24335 [Vibrio parahaemolyticus]